MEFNELLKKELKGMNAIGCTHEEVSELERQYHVVLPSDYRQFLIHAGRGSQVLWRGSDYTIDILPEMQEAGISLLEEAKLKLPEGSFIFFMHQGYQFFFLNSHGVFFFLEGSSEVERRYDFFAEFFVSTVHTL